MDTSGGSYVLIICPQLILTVIFFQDRFFTVPHQNAFSYHLLQSAK